MRSFNPLPPWAVLITAFLVGLTNASSDVTITSPATLTKIPIDVIERRAGPVSEYDYEKLHRLLFELTEDGTLIGHGVHLHILSDTKPLTPTTRSSQTHYSINGEEEDRVIFPEAHLREGNGYSVVFDSLRKTVVNVWGNGLFLIPLDQRRYPGVFINTRGVPMSTLKAFEKEITAHSVAGSDFGAAPLANVTTRQGGSCPIVEVAVTYDNSFCAIFSNSPERAAAFIQATVGFASFIFERDACVRMVLVHVEAHCQDPNDPYEPLSDLSNIPAGQRSAFILNGFRDFWNANRGSVHRDLAYFFSGFEEDTGTAGRAGLSAACTTNGYGWVEFGNGPVFVHELGHNMGCVHARQGIMSASLTQGDPVFFTAFSISQIDAFLATSEAGSCIDAATPPLCSSDCPGQCINDRCVALYDDTAPEGLVPCIPAQGLYFCTETLSFGTDTLFFGSDCPVGFEFLSPVTMDPNQRFDVFCCLPPTETRAAGVISSRYPFVTLNLQGEPRPLFIPELADIISGEILRTELVPSCIAPGRSSESPTPSPTLSPSASASESPPPPEPSESGTPTPSPSPTESPPPPDPSESGTPTASPSATESPLSPQASESNTPTASPLGSAEASPTPSPSQGPSDPTGTCGEALVASNTLSCSRGRARIRVRRVGIIRMRFEQAFGQFRALFTISRGARMTFARVTISTDVGVQANDVPVVTLQGSRQRAVQFSEDAFGMAIPDGETTCCREFIYIYAQIRVCRFSRCRVTPFIRKRFRIRCNQPCNGGPGAVLPFSSTKACPTCQATG